MIEPDKPTAPTRVCLIEDHPNFRETLQEALESTGRIDICASLSNAEDAFEFRTLVFNG